MYTYATNPFSQGFTEGSEPLILNYFVEYPKNKRFSIYYFVYIFYSLMDGLLLFLPYPLMLLDRCLTGACGINSATLRESSVQNYISDDKRAKLNALMNICYIVSTLLFKLILGALGEVLSVKAIMIGGVLCEQFVYYFILYRHKEKVKPIYNQIY